MPNKMGPPDRLHLHKFRLNFLYFPPKSTVLDPAVVLAHTLSTDINLILQPPFKYRFQSRVSVTIGSLKIPVESLLQGRQLPWHKCQGKITPSNPWLVPVSLGEFAGGHIHREGENGAPVIPSPQNVSTGVKGHGMNFARHFAASPLQVMFIYDVEQNALKSMTASSRIQHPYKTTCMNILCKPD